MIVSVLSAAKDGIARTTSLFFSKIVSLMPGTFTGRSTPALIPARPAPITATCPCQQLATHIFKKTAHFQLLSLVNRVLFNLEIGRVWISPAVVGIRMAIRYITIDSGIGTGDYWRFFVKPANVWSAAVGRDRRLNNCGRGHRENLDPEVQSFTKSRVGVSGIACEYSSSPCLVFKRRSVILQLGMEPACQSSRQMCR